jgi:DNA-binding transcriptional LysR family regulator
MPMDRIEDYAAFVAVVDSGSLTGAARRLGRSLQSVSRSLAALEREVGVELVRRTTRRSSPTEAGLALHRRLKAALAEIADAKLEVANRRSEPSGLLRVSASTTFAPLYVVPAVAAFLDSHPQLEIELELSDGFVDLVEGGFDLAVRIGEMPSSTLTAKRLADSRRVAFAAPAYFARHGRPKRPDQLSRHQCIVRTAAREGDAWAFTVDGRVKTLKVAGRFRASGAAAANEGAVRGLGIATAPLWQVRKLVDEGLVELTLTRFEPPPVPIHAVWPATRLPPAKTRLFVDFLAARLKAERL